MSINPLLRALNPAEKDAALKTVIKDNAANIINDYGPDDIFKRVFSSLSTTGDTLLAITTSGNSKNIIETLKLARERGIFSLGFLGNGGGEALSYCDLAFVVPSKITGRIQESHITAGHALLQYVEDSLLEKGWLIKE